ncbi:DEAD-box ATP-dependent RNA helicase 46-like isoform X1 [Cucumis melo]|uniref:RNA helicase n=1 Tax=Cucumis melo TaxID=3656 RepID=A0ABM3KWD7_CUCME|nr:DEAD-box ATP-dependent RNA helicase 46-like isoform X1 [Cucumis melo]
METGDSAPPSLGPRYAPDDPTLPKPWKGLIDGSSGLSYYWNPETNVTQYEKPVSLPPPLPLGPHPGVSTSKPTSIPEAHSMVSNGTLAPHVQQNHHVLQQDGQLNNQLSQQPGHLISQQHNSGQVVNHHPGMQMAPDGRQHSSQSNQVMPQQGVFAMSSQHIGPQQVHQGQKMAHANQQMSQHPNIQPPQNPGQALQNPGQQMPQPSVQHLGLPNIQNPTPLVGQPQGPQYCQQQLQYTSYQQNIPSNVQQNSQQQVQQSPYSQQQSQQSPLGMPFGNHLEQNPAFLKREENIQSGNQVGFSSSQLQQSGGTSSIHNLHSGTNSSQMQQFGLASDQARQFGSSPRNMQQQHPVVQLQNAGAELTHRHHHSRFQDQMGPAVMQGQQAAAENLPGRDGNEHYFGRNEGPGIGPHQPRLAAIPMARSQQDTRMSGLPFPTAAPGHPSGTNFPAGPAHNLYSHGSGSLTLSNNALMGPTHIGASDVTNMSPVEVYRQQHEVTASGDNVPAPFMTFEATGFPPEILREIYSAGFSSPTPIQAQTWPIALQGRDIVAIAKTGSGKTLGYLLPAFILLRQCRNNPQNGPTVLVLAPTRELATQIQDEAIKFGRSSRVCCTCLYGGAPKGPQLKELDRGADIVVATPGRLNDILEMKMINFRQISLLVLDEADRMLDMGFEPQIRKIVNEIPPRRQTLMYTATWPKEVRKIANDLLVNSVQVNIGRVDVLAANKAITQYVEVVPQMEKQRRLEQILRSQERGSKVIIFCSTKRLCDQLSRNLGRGFGAAAIHGDKSQGERDWVLNQFRSGKSPILVATDVAARGLDIKDIRVVINYDFPTGIEDYVHRIGRTGRAGATGVAYTFFSEQDWKFAADLIKVLEGAEQPVPPELQNMAMRGGPGFGKDRGGMGRHDAVMGGSRWDSGGRGGMSNGGFGGRGGARDGGFGGRGGMRDGGFGGRGGIRDGPGGRGGRGDFFSIRGRGRGFGGPPGGHVGWGRGDRGGPHNRFNGVDGRGHGRGQGRFDNRRDLSNRSRGRSYSRSPERVRTWGYSPSRSGSRSCSSRSWSRSRSRSHSRSRSRSRSRSWARRSRSRSRSQDNNKRPRVRNFDKKDNPPLESVGAASPDTQKNRFEEQEDARQLAPMPGSNNMEAMNPENGDTIDQTVNAGAQSNMNESE